MRHYVHVYHTMRSKFAVDAETHEEAIEKASKLFNETRHVRHGITGSVTSSMALEIHDQVSAGFLPAEDADEITGFLVDEAGDEDHEKSARYQPDGKTTITSATSL